MEEPVPAREIVGRRNDCAVLLAKRGANRAAAGRNRDLPHERLRSHCAIETAFWNEPPVLSGVLNIDFLSATCRNEMRRLLF
jgi:hypothetical protein